MRQRIAISSMLAKRNPYLAFEKPKEGEHALDGIYHLCTAVTPQIYDCLAIPGGYVVTGTGTVATDIQPRPTHGCDTCARREHVNFNPKS